ncbi:DUF4157 domain-containing protein, partial [Streptomyces barkulensis]
PAGLLGLQASAGNAAVTRMVQRARCEADGDREWGGAAPVQRSTVHQVLRGPGRPLDAPLREEMEARLGADFSDVRLHTGAAARRSAAEIGARAYTSGRHVVIGDGGADRHTLAHELTHVIQQRHGAVTGTDRGDGLRVSDPGDRFERAAEANARRALAGPAPVRQAEATAAGAGRKAGEDTPVQRAIAWYKQSTNSLDAFGRALGDLVENAAETIIASPDHVPVTNNGYIERWYQVVNAYMSDRSKTAFLHTAFGYAVEALVTARLNEIRGHLPAGWTIATQVTHGHTRPDIVVFDDQRVEQAWFDITSLASTGHIGKKTGTAWGTRPHVAEVVYPPLDPTRLAPGNATPEQREQLQQAAEQERQKERDLVLHLDGLATTVYKHMLDDVAVGNDKAKQRKFFEEHMYALLGDAAVGAMRTGTKLPPNTAKSFLAHLDKYKRKSPDDRPWPATFGYTGNNATGRDPVTFERILNELVVRGKV